MILFDFNNISSIKYSVVISEVLKDQKEVFKKTKIAPDSLTKEQIKDLMQGFFKFMIDDLRKVNKLLVPRYNDVIICSDYNKHTYWRKQLLPSYKSNRDTKSDAFQEVAWSHFNNHRKMLLQALKFLGYKVMAEITTTFNNTEVSLEADEIIGVLSTKPGKHVIYSSDKDFYQCMLYNDNVSIHNPILNKLVKKTKTEIKELNLMSCLIGQKKDNIPSIKHNTELNETFIKWMKTKHNLTITQDMLSTIKKDEYRTYRDDFVQDMKLEDIELIESGKRKLKRNLTPFNKAGLGEAGAKNLLKTYNNIEDILNINPLYRENYELNEKLYYLDKIPLEIKNVILDTFSNLTTHKDPIKIAKLGKVIGLGMIDSMKLKELSNS